MLKRILFTHDDLDGAGAAIIFKLLHSVKYGNMLGEYQIHTCHIGQDLYDHIDKYALNSDNVDADTEIIFCDICCSEYVMQQLMQKFNTITVFDHHPNIWITKYPSINNHIITSSDGGALPCGTSIMADWYRCVTYTFMGNTISFKDILNDAKVLVFIDAVRSYDTFEFKTFPNEDAYRLNSLFRLYGMENFIERSFNELLDHENPSIFTKYEKMIIDYQISKEDETINSIIDNTPGYVCSIRTEAYTASIFPFIRGINMSELASRYLTKHGDIDVFIWYNMDTKTVSMRSVKDNIFVNKICQKLGGNGHPKAAGAVLPEHIVNRMMDNTSDTGVEMMKYINIKTIGTDDVYTCLYFTTKGGWQ